MIALLQMRLREHLQKHLAEFRLLGQSGKGDILAAPKVFIGDTPPKRGAKDVLDESRDLPCLVIIPMSGGLLVEDGAVENEAVLAICCAVYNPEKGERGDLAEVEGDLANLLSATIGALLPAAQGEALDKRFVLCADEKGRMLSWARPESQPKDFASVTITSRWKFKGWE